MLSGIVNVDTLLSHQMKQKINARSEVSRTVNGGSSELPDGLRSWRWVYQRRMNSYKQVQKAEDILPQSYHHLHTRPLSVKAHIRRCLMNQKILEKGVLSNDPKRHAHRISKSFQLSMRRLSSVGRTLWGKEVDIKWRLRYWDRWHCPFQVLSLPNDLYARNSQESLLISILEQILQGIQPVSHPEDWSLIKTSLCNKVGRGPKKHHD